MFDYRILNALAGLNFNAMLNNSHMEKLSNEEMEAVNKLAFHASESVTQKLAQIQSITNAVMVALSDPVDSPYDPAKDGYNLMVWLNSEAKTIETLLGLAEDAATIQRVQEGYASEK